MAVGKVGSNYNTKFLEKNLHILLGVLVYSSAFYFLSFITADTDLWGHIKFGEDLWVSKALSRFDVYSFTAHGREWINHEWLSELLMYFVYYVFGSPGLLIGKLLIGFTIIFLLTKISLYREHHPIVYGPVFGLSVFVMSPGFMTRPQILTFLFTSLFLYVIHLYLERRRDLLWVLPLIMILWVNCHGGFLVGLGLFPVVVICEIISCRVKKKDMAHLRGLIFWLLLTEASVLINPYGYRILDFLYQSLSAPRSIGEWNSIGILDFSYLRYKLFVILFVLSLFFNKTRNRYWEIGIIVIVMILAFRHQRHTPLFAIVAASYLTEKLSIFGKQIKFYDRIKSFPSYLILSISLSFLIIFQLFHTTNRYIEARFNILVDPGMYPVYPVHFLKENEIKGNILLPFEWGEYVIWKLYPDSRVSIDGRFRTVYPKEVLDAHFATMIDESMFKELLKKYPSDIILARRNSFFQHLMSSQEKWVYIYSDSNTIIFVKNTDSQKGVIERLKRKELVYPNKKLSIYFP